MTDGSSIINYYSVYILYYVIIVYYLFYIVLLADLGQIYYLLLSQQGYILYYLFYIIALLCQTGKLNF